MVKLYTVNLPGERFHESETDEICLYLGTKPVQ